MYGQGRGGTQGYGSGMQGYGSGMQGYGSGMQGYGSGTQGYGSMGGMAATEESLTSEEQRSTEEKTVSKVLTALGLRNEGGHLRWPLPLRVLASPGTEERQLREEIDALVELAITQATPSAVNPTLFREMDQALKEYRTLSLRDRPERIVFSRAAWNEAERFLDRLEHARELLQGGVKAAKKESELRTQEGLLEVGVHDNYIEPASVTVSAGTTVQWSNEGQHRHTVTADDGSWTSQEMTSGAVYQHTFTQPGTYTYHCTKHPREMRGTIIVK
jgi:plastocyanin